MTQQIPCLTIFSEKQGYLNSRARHLLFGDALEGWIAYNLDGRPLSLAPAPDHLGWRVGKAGHVTVKPVTALTGRWPISFRLEPHPEHARLLLFAEVISKEPS